MKIGFICDIHMAESDVSPQREFLKKAIRQMKEDNISVVINLGDITASGEYEAFEAYNSMLKCFKHYSLIGNSDVRDKETAQNFIKKSSFFKFDAENMSVWGINTPYDKIEEEDREKLLQINHGDIILMHHSISALNEDSRNFLMQLLNNKKITLIHAHSHKWMDYSVGISRVVCLRALDPDKSIGNFPCITYYDTESNSFEEKLFAVSRNAIQEAKSMFGISCVDNHSDLEYALEKEIYAVELRCNGDDWKEDYTLIPKIEEWRKKTNGYLSVHMPNLRYKNGKITGTEQWKSAAEYAKRICADGITMHPPRVKIKDFEKTKNKFLMLYLNVVEIMSSTVSIGIENLHMGDGENIEDRCFGYTPQEVCMWIDEINRATGKENRVGHTLDVGHARNNGILSEKFPISRWYEIMGKRTVAYHIHQVIPVTGGYSNHQAIENWFGPMISYASYFYCWEKNIINHAPVFLEVQGHENYQRSIDGFEKYFN